jgi:hypothetical protein
MSQTGCHESLLAVKPPGARGERTRLRPALPFRPPSAITLPWTSIAGS